MPTKKATKTPAKRPPRPVIQPTKDAPEGGRTVMQRVDKLPEPARGRPNDKYLKLCEAVIGEFGAGVAVKLIEFSDEKSAYRAMNEILGGKRPVPGGPGEWEVRAIVESVEGQTEKGSALYVEWLGEAE
jgi:hypothetical protein